MTLDMQVVKYTVKKEDNLWNIVKKAGFPPKDWKKILAAPYNKELVSKLKKEKRSADKIFPGDIIFLPAFNSKDIAKQFESVKKLRLQLGDKLQSLAKHEHVISQFKSSRAKDVDARKNALKELKPEYKRLNKLHDMNLKPIPGERGGERMGKAILKEMIKNDDGSVRDIGRQIVYLEKYLVTSKEKYEASLVTLEKMLKREKKNINQAASAVQNCETELSKMLKSPY